VVDVPAPDRTPKQPAEQMAAVARRDGSKRLAADSAEVLDGRRMSKHDLRAELRRLDEVIQKAPRDQSRLLALATSRREQHDQRLAEATTRPRPRPRARHVAGGRATTWRSFERPSRRRHRAVDSYQRVTQRRREQITRQSPDSRGLGQPRLQRSEMLRRAARVGARRR
jgi:hypothetical protein